MLEIIEILNPSVQGKTKPYLCRAEDDILYYVKGKNSKRKSQCCEWLVGNLAVAFGLPVAPFELVNISSELLAEAPLQWQEIGTGIAFGSQKQRGTYWFEPNFVGRVSDQLRRDVLAFDWWVRNMDRQYDNPNLLWAEASKGLIVIDYDSALDVESFFPTIFQSYHIFAQESDKVFGDLACQAEYAKRFSDALAVWQEACDNIPSEWLTGPFDISDEPLDLLAARELLDKCLTNELWRVE